MGLIHRLYRHHYDEYKRCMSPRRYTVGMMYVYMGIGLLRSIFFTSSCDMFLMNCLRPEFLPLLDNLGSYESGQGEIRTRGLFVANEAI